VAGMRGTGSNTLVAKDAFVPDHRIISVPSAVQGHYCTEHTDEALYRSAYIPVASLVLAGPQLGLAWPLSTSSSRTTPRPAPSTATPRSQAALAAGQEAACSGSAGAGVGLRVGGGA